MNKIKQTKKLKLSNIQKCILNIESYVKMVLFVLFVLFVFDFPAYPHSFLYSLNHKKGFTVCTTARLNSKSCNLLKRIVF